MEAKNLTPLFSIMEELMKAGIKVYQVRFYSDMTDIYTGNKSIPSEVLSRLAVISPYIVKTGWLSSEMTQMIRLTHPTE